MTTKELIDSAYQIGRDHADCKLWCEAQVALVELERTFLEQSETVEGGK